MAAQRITAEVLRTGNKRLNPKWLLLAECRTPGAALVGRIALNKLTYASIDIAKASS